MQIRVSALDFVVVMCYVIIGGFLWRSLAAKLADRPLGKAMGYIL